MTVSDTYDFKLPKEQQYTMKCSQAVSHVSSELASYVAETCLVLCHHHQGLEEHMCCVSYRQPEISCPPGGKGGEVDVSSQLLNTKENSVL